MSTEVKKPQNTKVTLGVKADIVILPSEVIEELRSMQTLILKKLSSQTRMEEDNQYISGERAAKMFDCDKQTICNFEKEGLIKRYGRKRFIRYSVNELQQALGMIND